MFRTNCVRALLLSLFPVALFFSVSSQGRPDAAADLKTKVNQLVEQLGNSDSSKQTAAATALIQLGPDILPLLPSSDEKLTPDQIKHLKSVRTTLRDAQAQQDLAPRTFTLQTPAITLTKALKELAKQTGIEVDDARRNQEEDTQFKLDVKKATFWQALDAIAKQADLRVLLYGPSKKIAVTDGPHRSVPVSYSGIFRVALKRIETVRILELDQAHMCVAYIEVAWEPRFQPLFLESRADAMTVEDEKGRALNLIGNGSGRVSVMKRRSIEIPVRLEAPPRSAQKIGLLKGALSVIGPSRMVNFRFDNLAPFESSKAEKVRKETKDDVSVKMRDFTVDGDLWTFGLTIEYPADNPDFESFESWLGSNEIYLEKKSTKQRIGDPSFDDSPSQGGRRAVLTYHFTDDKNLLDKPADWVLIYRTPGRMSTVPVTFEFKDVPLP